MNDLMLFTDGSVNTISNTGYGAYLVLSEQLPSLDACRARTKVKRFDCTSSAKLELQTLLWALSNIDTTGCRVIVHTDSQNIMNLQARRESLEQSDYRSKKKRRLNNYKLYQEFYKITDQINCKFVKVSGHKVHKKKNNIDRLFSLVDRASRNALRG